MKTLDPEQVERARKILTQVRSRWLARPGVTGLDVGLRERDGTLRDEIAIRVYVIAKRPRDCLHPEERFPNEIEGVPVDVIEFDPEARPGR